MPARGCGLANSLAAKYLIAILTRCVTKEFDIVSGAEDYVREEIGISAFGTPAVLQVLVATALKHRNKEVLAKLVVAGPAPRHESVNIFRMMKEPSEIESTFSSILGDPNYGPAAWSVLSDAGWASQLRFPDRSAPGAEPDGPTGQQQLNDAISLARNDPAAGLTAFDNLLASGWKAYPSMGGTLDALIESGTGDMVAHFLAVLPRSYYDGVPPRATWPGEKTTAQKAAAVPGRLGALRALVEIGGMDVNGTEWYRSGPIDDWRSHETRFEDGSCANETPLHAAVQAGDPAVVEYLLQCDARRCKDDWGRDQLERARFLKKDELVALFKAHGWE